MIFLLLGFDLRGELSSVPAMWHCVEHWWNGIVYQHKCRDIWLSTNRDGRWKVQARQGERSNVWSREFDNEAAARVLIEQMKQRTGERWSTMSNLNAPP